MITGKYKLNELFVCGDDEEGGDKPDYAALLQAPEAQEYINSLLGTKIQEAVERETGALKKSKAEILDEKKKLESQIKGFASTAEDQADLDALKSGQLPWKDFVDKRVAANNSSWEERLNSIETEKSDLQKRAEESDKKLKQYQLRTLIGQEAMKNEFFLPSALEDMLAYAANQCELSESSEIIFRDKNGNIRIGKNGKPLAAAEWIQDLTTEKPHYYKLQVGSGSKGSGNPGGQRTMSLNDWRNALATANPEEQKKLLAAKASGELRVSQ